MAKNITVPQEVKQFLKQPKIAKLLKEDNLVDVYYEVNNDYYLDSEMRTILWEVFVLAGINLADAFTTIPPILRKSTHIKKLDLTGDMATSIAEGFAMDSNIEEVTIGDSIQSIGANAFSNCPKLKRVILGDEVTKIGGDAFASCPNLHEIYLPESVRYIGRGALQANDDCYIFSPPRKPGSLHILGDISWYREHLGVDPRYREDDTVEEEEITEVESE